MPISGLVQSTVTVAKRPYGMFVGDLAKVTNAEKSLYDLRLRQGETWPKVMDDAVPEDLPEVVERAFRQGEQNFRQPDCEEAAATMYRRALDVGLKHTHPDVTGSLDQKIKKLVQSHELPPALGEWAHAVRLIGNDGAHDIEGVTREELGDARSFIDTVLRYIFTLPARIATRNSPSQTVEE